MLRMRQRYPVVVLTLAVIVTVLASCGGAASTSSPPGPPPPPSATPSLVVTSVSSTTPGAMTPLTINTTGLNVNAAVSVQFSNSNGFSVSEQPIRVTSNGTIIAATPLYVDPSSGTTGAGTVSLVLSQGNLSSAPLTLNIQDLPSVSSYGTTPGQISHAFLTYSEMRIARRLGELQAAQELPGNTVDTSAAQQSLSVLLRAVIEARNDVDRVAVDNSLVISGGSLSNGTPIQFDAHSLDMMDRTFALYLTQLSPTYSLPSAATKPLMGLSVPRRPSKKHSRPLPAFIVSPQQASSNVMSNILNYITTASNLTALTQAYSDGTAKDATVFDKTLAVANGAGALYGLATIGGSVAQVIAGAAYGALLSGVSLLNHTGMELGDLAFIYVASRNGTDPAVIQEAQNDLNNNANAALYDTINTELSLAQVGAPLESFGSGVVGTFLNSAAGSVSLQSAQFLTGAAQCAQSSCFAAIETTVLNVASEIKNVFASDTQGIGEVQGSVDISNSQGSTLAADTGIEVGPFDVSSSDMTALADPNGNYDFFVPLQAPNTNYGLLMVTAFDPVAGTTLASSPVNLTGLNTSAPVMLPTLQGGCNDSDASNPDSDDPDCD